MHRRCRRRFLTLPLPRSYVRQALAFNIQRCGFLYGECDDAGNAKAHFIYEPPQQARARLRVSSPLRAI